MGNGNDTLTIHDGVHNQAFISGGSGFDTLNFTGNGHNLDMTKVSTFEAIDLSGAKNSEIDVQLSDLVKDDNDKLFIKGLGSNNRVDLGDNGNNWHDGNGSWHKAGTQEVDGIQYDIYHHSASSTESLYIEQGIQVI